MPIRLRERRMHVLRCCLTGAVLLLAAGHAAWTPEAVTALPAADRTDAGGVDQRAPAAAYIGDGTAQLVWVEDRGNGADIYGKSMHASGRAVGGAGREGRLVIRASADPDHGPRYDPSLVGGSVTAFLVWSEMRPGDDGHDIFGIRVASGYSRGSPTLLVGGIGDQRRPFLLASSCCILLLWDDNAREPSEIWGQYFSNITFRPQSDPFPIVQGPGNARDAVIYGYK